MNTFKRKSLHAAVLAGLGAVGFAGTASAVNLAQDGLGSVLLYPYYTVRADGGGTSNAFYDTLISVVNTTTTFKAVKVRFMEGKRSAEVLDFNLFLSPRDVWTGAVTRTSDGARLVSSDNSCVVPNSLFSTSATNTLNAFKNFVYGVAPLDGGGVTLDRAREGHFEMLEMGVFTAAAATAAALHNSAGVPANCAFFQNNDQTPVNLGLLPPQGGLAGGASLINVAAGSDYSYDAVALTNWATNTQYSRAGSLTPNLGSGNVFTSSVFRPDGSVVIATWANGLDAVSATLMAQNVVNEFVLETSTNSGTDWVVTFPTKFGYVNVGAGQAGIGPFNANFNNGASCDIFGFQFWNREEQTPGITTIVLPSPEPIIPVTNNTFCFETNVLTFANSNNLGSDNRYNVDPTASALNPTNRTGWGQITFNQVPVGTQTSLQRLITATATTVSPTGVATAAGVTHLGLPVIGFMVQDFANGNVGGVLSNYGGLFSHKYNRVITSP
jgi:hypothetical protein